MHEYLFKTLALLHRGMIFVGIFDSPVMPHSFIAFLGKLRSVPRDAEGLLEYGLFERGYYTKGSADFYLDEIEVWTRKDEIEKDITSISLRRRNEEWSRYNFFL